MGRIQQSGFVRFEFHAGQPCQAGRSQSVILQHATQCADNLLPRHAPAATDPSPEAARMQHQARSVLIFPADQHLCLRVVHQGERLVRFGVILQSEDIFGIMHRDLSAFGQHSVHMHDAGRSGDDAVPALGQGVDGGLSGRVRGRGDDGTASEVIGDTPGQLVGSAEMAGQQADDVLCVLVADDHGRVL